MADRHDDGGWVQYDHLNQTYNTRDGTIVPGELVDSACCLADVLYIALIRDKQRAMLRARKEDTQ